MTWLVSDNLAMGALIAILLRTPAATLSHIRALTLAAAVAGASLLLLGVRLHLLRRNTAAGAAFEPEPFILLFAALLLLALQFGQNPMVLRLTRPLRFYGYLSYGLYLFHLVGFGIYQDLFTDLSHPVPLLTLGQMLLRFCAVLAFTTLFCFLSRRYFEEFFLHLKDRLAPYTSSNRTLPVQTPIASPVQP
jgi:peptidoglycan/LPS O-acetylase OafA/YrhL